MIQSLDTGLLHEPVINPSSKFLHNSALVLGKETLTRVDLQKSVIQATNWLINEGCKKGDRVGICLPKNLYTVEIIFACLSAGGIFVPIDPNAPVARVAYLLKDAGASHLITYSVMASALENNEIPIETKIYSVDDYEGFHELIGNYSEACALPDISTEDTALLYYTSGTTGTPKAIMLSHKNVHSFAQWTIDTFKITGEDTIASHAPFHFDLSTLDLFAATRVGARVILLDEASIKFPSRVSQIMETFNISIWYSVPTALIHLLHHGVLERRNLQSLRLVLYAGEIFPVPELTKIMKQLSWCEFVNLYGPTETNVCTYYRFINPPKSDDKDVPIGIACEHLAVKLINDNGTETVSGETGEIVVFGPSVMQGYWNRPELTKQSRYNNDDNSYRTGDFAYYDSDGQLHLTGRKDDQVKIRGHRVELLEVISVINLHPEVLESAVLLSQPEGEDVILTAFIATKPGNVPATEDILEHCRQWLPKYAVPKEIITMDQLPKTTTGKTDRQKLRQYLDTN